MTLTAIQLLFYVFALLAVASAVMVVTAQNPVRSVLSLVATFFAMAGIWMLLQAEFLSLILLLVYVGAVMTLFLFVVMMLAINIASKQATMVRYWPLGLILLLLLMVILVIQLHDYFSLAPLTPISADNNNNLASLGLLFFTNYLYPFEIAGVLLLAAIIAAITLTHRGPVKRKNQDPGKQVAIQRADRVKLVKMTASRNDDSGGVKND